MTLAVDYAWNGPSLTSIKQAGYTGILRYLSHDGSKNLSPQERDAARALGLDICLVWETTADRAGQGNLAGVQDARDANNMANTLNYPRTCAMYYAVDFDASADQVRPYFQGIATSGGRPVGVYGGINVVEGIMRQGLAKYGWQTVAWSGGLVSKMAHLYQRLKPTTALQGDYDEDAVLIAEYGQWKVGGFLMALTDAQQQELYEKVVHIFNWCSNTPSTSLDAAVNKILSSSTTSGSSRS